MFTSRPRRLVTSSRVTSLSMNLISSWIARSGSVASATPPVTAIGRRRRTSAVASYSRAPQQRHEDRQDNHEGRGAEHDRLAAAKHPQHVAYVGLVAGHGRREDGRTHRPDAPCCVVDGSVGGALCERRREPTSRAVVSGVVSSIYHSDPFAWKSSPTRGRLVDERCVEAVVLRDERFQAEARKALSKSPAGGLVQRRRGDDPVEGFSQGVRIARGRGSHRRDALRQRFPACHCRPRARRAPTTRARTAYRPSRKDGNTVARDASISGRASATFPRKCTRSAMPRLAARGSSAWCGVGRPRREPGARRHDRRARAPATPRRAASWRSARPRC